MEYRLWGVHLQANPDCCVQMACSSAQKGVASGVPLEDSSVGCMLWEQHQQLPAVLLQAGSGFTWRSRKPRGGADQLTTFPQRMTQGKCLSLQQQCFESLQSLQTSAGCVSISSNHEANSKAVGHGFGICWKLCCAR